MVESEPFRFLVIASDTLEKNLEKGLKTLNRSGFACSRSSTRKRNQLDEVGVEGKCGGV